ncbi:zinc finger CCCH domain-containing protein 37 isoform X1 [Nicotiana sylvestris]|uniref:Zinc finger CCCH domain-containing protein 37 isoform X1 n=1 Tax=Nicotiana sylvestris TaxID=4096 RepID=A0A1U7WXI1_NICSY|nr:PREDICTED: zinc finger CCCH domain-containing protein 37 isoform X1 [Nicotiana sylvestris]
MANQLYGYNPSSNAGIAAGSNLSRTTTRSMDDYLSTDNNKPFLGSSSYFGSSGYSFSSPTMLFNQSDSYNPAASKIPGLAAYQSSWTAPPGVDVAQPPAADSYFSSLKRSSSDALYHRTLLGARNTIGQAEAWFSANPLAKRPRFESASNLSIYPQRPGEKDCAHYMQTRTCKFGDSCKFDHPIWVPEGGIPDWKEVPVITESLPERPGEPDCPYFMKTQKCKFGNRCKFNHPKDNTAHLGSVQNSDVSVLPERPSEPSCAFYMKTGACKFGATCKFHHPRDIQLPSPKQESGSAENPGSANNEMTEDVNLIKPLSVPALLHNSKGLPIRPGEVDCPFYLKTGSCKYGGTCRYNHPERTAAIGPALVASPATHLNIGMVNPAASLLQNLDPRLTQTMLGLLPPVYPQRPGQIECDFYMKTGECKFGERCKFHHPLDRSAPVVSAKDVQQPNVKLTLAGLPRREGAVHCPYYMKTGMCKYGATCKFDHPPPGEVLGMATSQGASLSVEGEDTVDVKEQQQ